MLPCACGMTPMPARRIIPFMEPVAFPEELLERAKRGNPGFSRALRRARAFTYRIGVVHFDLHHEDADDIAKR